jgi:flagellar basal-body rod modification protein FlgD
MITLPSSDLDIASLALSKTESNKGRDELGQQDFLMLMISQFRNQDPFQPLESGEFIGQMAQFSTVSGISEINKSMSDLVESLTANQALQASALVGRTVLAEGDMATLGEAKPLQGGVELPFATDTGFVRIYDSNSQLMTELPLDSRNAGLATFEWDGTRADGTTAPVGNYQIIAGMRNGAEEEALATFIGTNVQSVTLSGGGRNAHITTEAGQEISLSQVKAIM